MKIKTIFLKYKETIKILVVLLSSFLLFGFLFYKTETGSFYQNIISVLIGSVLTTVFLSLLLNQQSKSDQVKEQNVEVFKKKVEKYEKVIALLVEASSGKQLNLDGLNAIKHAIYEVSLFCGKDTLSMIGDYLKQETIGGVTEENKISILDITAQMRSELKLDKLHIFDREDVLPIELLIKSNLTLLPIYRNINEWLDSFYSVFDEQSFETDLDWEFKALEGSGDTIGFAINPENHDELDFYNISIQYPKDITDELFLVLNVVFHSKRLHCVKDENIIIEASKVGVEYTLDDDSPYEVDGFKHYFLKSSVKSKRLKIDTKKQIELANSIISDIVQTEDIFKEKLTNT